MSSVDAQNAKKLNRKGAYEYNDGKFDNAAKLFEEAGKISDNPIHPYNLGNALFKNEIFEKAIESYSESLSRNPDEKLIKKNLYNRGNAYHLLERYDESIADYKNTLKIDPTDKNAKINLLKSKIKKRIQQQQNQRQNQQQKRQQHENQYNNKENNTNEDHQENNTNDQNQENDGNDDTKQSVDTENLSAAEQNESGHDNMQKSELNRLLNMVDNEDQKVNKKLKEKKSQPSRSKKDW